MDFLHSLTLDQILSARLTSGVFLSLLQIAVGLIFLRQRERIGWVVLLGGILQLFSVLMTRWVYTLPHYGGATEMGMVEDERDRELFFWAEMINYVGSTLFFVGLLIATIRRRALSARIAELEQILAAQNSRVP